MPDHPTSNEQRGAASSPPGGSAPAPEAARPGGPEPFTTTFLGIDAMCHVAGQLGEASRIERDPAGGTTVAWTDFGEDDPRPMVKLHLRPGAECAEIEYLRGPTFYGLAGWCAVHGLEFHVVSAGRIAEDTDGDGDTPESYRLIRLSIPRWRIDAIAEVLSARGGERVKPAQIEGEGVWRVLAKHPGALVAYHVENGDPGRLRCGLFARDAGWLDATAAAIADALGEPVPGAGRKGGGAPGGEETDADA